LRFVGEKDFVGRRKTFRAAPDSLLNKENLIQQNPRKRSI
jgi:hypothetical protein